MSDTPRTDAKADWLDRREHDRPPVEIVLADFARELERENARLAAEVARLRSAIREGIDEARTFPCNTDSLVDDILAPALTPAQPAAK